jgi:hypothetical protein
LHQDKGVSGEVYPLTIIFHGEQFDQEADAFMKLSTLPGRGILNHPRWGQRVVQIISCTQNEDWVNRVGVSVIDVEFQESLDREFAEPVASTLYEVADLIKSYNVLATANFGEEIVVDTLDLERSFKDQIVVATNRVYQALFALATADDDVAGLFFGGIRDITTNLDEYVAAPLRFAESIINIIRAPATLVGRVDSKLIAYGSLLDSLPFRNVDDDSRETKNGMLTDELVGSAAIASVSESINEAVANTSTIQRDDKGRALITVPIATVGFQTRSEALAAALYLRTSLLFLTDYLDTAQDTFKDNTLYEMYIQTIENFGGISALVTAVMQSALNLSFRLPAKRAIILTADSTIINECYTFYGSVEDAALDYFIQTNNFNGAEIKLLPKGREIIYYA